MSYLRSVVQTPPDSKCGRRKPLRSQNAQFGISCFQYPTSNVTFGFSYFKHPTPSVGILGVQRLSASIVRVECLNNQLQMWHSESSKHLTPSLSLLVTKQMKFNIVFSKHHSFSITNYLSPTIGWNGNFLARWGRQLLDSNLGVSIAMAIFICKEKFSKHQVLLNIQSNPPLSYVFCYLQIFLQIFQPYVSKCLPLD